MTVVRADHAAVASAALGVLTGSQWGYLAWRGDRGGGCDEKPHMLMVAARAVRPDVAFGATAAATTAAAASCARSPAVGGASSDCATAPGSHGRALGNSVVCGMVGLTAWPVAAYPVPVMAMLLEVAAAELEYSGCWATPSDGA